MTTATEQKKTPRPPVAVVMGHIDHGKTALLDAIRKTNVAGEEAGGITQHIGAYEITHNSQRITFIDTPGHEAFGKMRMRGARVADVAILVIAADEGVKPQTLEALDAIRKADIPFLIALNKIDKPQANAEQVKKELSGHNIYIEEWGGKIPLIAVSAKESRNIGELLNLVLLLAELEELKTDLNAPGSGVVIETHVDPRRGNSATLLVTNGVLRQSDFVLAGDASTKIKILENDRSEKIQKADASMPVRVVGFDALPLVGSEFTSFSDKRAFEASRKAVKEAVGEQPMAAEKDIATGDYKIPILIKSDVAGSKEALEDELRKVSLENAAFKVIEGGIGDIGEADIKAIASEKGSAKAIVVGFRVKIAPQAQLLGERFEIKMKSFDVIYEAIEWIKNTAISLVPRRMIKEEHGILEVLKVFKQEKGEIVVGGKVLSGQLTQQDRFDVLKRGKRIGGGVIKNIEQDKRKVEKVTEGSLCGLSLAYLKQIEKGDRISAFVEKEAVGVLA